MEEVLSITSQGSSTGSEFIVVQSAAGSQPRRSSVDSEQLKQSMADALGDDNSNRDSPVNQMNMSDFVDHDEYIEDSDREYPAPDSYTDSDQEGITPIAGSRNGDYSDGSSSADGAPHRRQVTNVDDVPYEESDQSQSDYGEPPAHSDINRQSSVNSTVSHASSVLNNQSSTKIDEQDNTIFDGITYLGAAMVNAPRSDVEIKRNMAILNDHNSMAIKIRLLIPSKDGIVRLTGPDSDSEVIASFKLHRIIFITRGGVSSAERNCFAFTCSHGDNSESIINQCHVFRCDLSDAVGKILYCFSKSFKRINKKNPPMSASMYEDNLFTFDASMEIKEDDGKGGHSSCPQDSGAFKMRQDVKKLVTLTLTLTSGRELRIERCFGILLSPGRNIKNSDMHLIEMGYMGYDQTGRVYTVSGEWNPSNDNFEVLNTETEKDMRVFMTVAVDLVFNGIREPVRFVVETKARVFPRNERFWYFTKKHIRERFYMHLKQASGGSSSGDQEYELEKLQSETQRDRSKAMTLTINRSQRLAVESVRTPGGEEEEESDDEAPMVSGSGHVSKEITDSQLLNEWAETLKKWHNHLQQRPKQVSSLCKKGIPEALRGEVWQLLASCHDSEMIEAYRILITKDSPCEETITRDLHRTFPAHEYFQEAGGIGQDSLFRLTKAYSVYDEEVGYCQGLSFLVAALLLHMPEEQAFAVLVKIMFNYQLRNFFKDGFVDLHLRFYQLERLLQDQVPDLYSHLLDMQLEAHMYASQWFLTLFTAKFPLYLVYRILDLFLCNGINTIFHVAVGLLKDSRRELLALDFEGVLKFFRVSLPKKYRTERNAHQLLDTAIRTKISNTKLKKYEKEFEAIRAAQLQQEDPVERYERDNKRLMEQNMRLEQENDSLAHELVTSKVTLRNDLDSAEDSCEELMKKLSVTARQRDDVDEMKTRLATENSQLKEKYRVEVCRVEEENQRNKEIIKDYKQICTQLSERLEKSNTSNKEEAARYQSVIRGCAKCSKALESSKTPLPQPAGQDNPNAMAASKDKKIRELELELAKTKLALVEAECKTQEMSHELSAVVNELQATKNNWWNKSLSSIREVVNKKGEPT